MYICIYTCIYIYVYIEIGGHLRLCCVKIIMCCVKVCTRQCIVNQIYIYIYMFGYIDSEIDIYIHIYIYVNMYLMRAVTLHRGGGAVCLAWWGPPLGAGGLWWGPIFRPKGGPRDPKGGGPSRAPRDAHPRGYYIKCPL